VGGGAPGGHEYYSRGGAMTGEDHPSDWDHFFVESIRFKEI